MYYNFEAVILAVVAKTYLKFVPSSNLRHLDMPPYTYVEFGH